MSQNLPLVIHGGSKVIQKNMNKIGRENSQQSTTNPE